MTNKFWDELPDHKDQEAEYYNNKKEPKHTKEEEKAVFDKEESDQELEYLRDQAAVAAMQGILAHDGAYGFGSGPGDITEISFDFADAFIAEKKRRDESENR
jgi:hypothetical protein